MPLVRQTSIRWWLKVCRLAGSVSGKYVRLCDFRQRPTRSGLSREGQIRCVAWINWWGSRVSFHVQSRSLGLLLVSRCTWSRGWLPSQYLWPDGLLLHRRFWRGRVKHLVFHLSDQMRVNLRVSWVGPGLILVWPPLQRNLARVLCIASFDVPWFNNTVIDIWYHA